MRTRIEILAPNKSTGFMKMKRSEITEIEQGTFTPLVFTTTGGMADECLRHHSRLAELLSAKKQESYATTISWVRAKVSFATLLSELLYLRGWRTPRRRNLDVKDRDLKIERVKQDFPRLNSYRYFIIEMYIEIFCF